MTLFPTEGLGTDGYDDRDRHAASTNSDWLGTPYLRFTREGPFGVYTLDRPEARNAMTPAMYFGSGTRNGATTPTRMLQVC